MLAGKYPGAPRDIDAAEKIRALVAAGVRTFVDLTEDGELRPYAHLLPAGIAHARIPVRDVTCPSAEQVRRVLDAIADGTKAGIVYLHCWGGCGRTGVILGCYLVEQGWTPEAALTQVQALTRAALGKHCPETQAQAQGILTWHPSRV